MTIRIVRDSISGRQLRELAEETYGEMIKAVVDVERELLAVGGEMHADSEARLLEEGSGQDSLWGINLRFDRPSPDRIEYTSLINIRPRQKNNQMEVQDPALRERIRKIVDRKVRWD